MSSLLAYIHTYSHRTCFPSHAIKLLCCSSFVVEPRLNRATTVTLPLGRKAAVTKMGVGGGSTGGDGTGRSHQDDRPDRDPESRDSLRDRAPDDQQRGPPYTGTQLTLNPKSNPLPLRLSLPQIQRIR